MFQFSFVVFRILLANQSWPVPYPHHFLVWGRGRNLKVMQRPKDEPSPSSNVRLASLCPTPLPLPPKRSPSNVLVVNVHLEHSPPWVFTSLTITLVRAFSLLWSFEHQLHKRGFIQGDLQGVRKNLLTRHYILPSSSPLWSYLSSTCTLVNVTRSEGSCVIYNTPWIREK